jgi:parallel beta-helix repeat protein
MLNRRNWFRAAVCALFCAAVSGQQTGAVFMVDDDGAQCPGALATIQEAVAQAPEGATILVCPGTYRNQVTIRGAEKTGLKLIALGHDGEVVLEGDHTEPFGFLLDDVTNVLIRGFTIRGWGNKPTTASQYGWGCGIHLQRAHYNTIEHNRISKTDMVGINLDHSGHNLIRYNLMTEIDPQGVGCGILMSGGKDTAENFIYANRVALSPGAGILVWGAGPGNAIVDNNFNNNGQGGISHLGTEGTLIEGNRFSHNAGAWGVILFEPDPRSYGILIKNSDKVTVTGNMAHNNTLVDISWDNKGSVVFENNACRTSNQTGICGR